MHHLRLLGGLAAGYVVLDRAAAPALLRFVAQGAIKLTVVQDGAQVTLGLGWMAVCAVLPWAAFAVPARKTR